MGCTSTGDVQQFPVATFLFPKGGITRIIQLGSLKIFSSPTFLICAYIYNPTYIYIYTCLFHLFWICHFCWHFPVPGPGREQETHAEGATKASQEGAEGHDAVAELIAEGILDLPRTTWSWRGWTSGIQCHHHPISRAVISQSSEMVTTRWCPPSPQWCLLVYKFISPILHRYLL